MTILDFPTVAKKCFAKPNQNRNNKNVTKSFLDVGSDNQTRKEVPRKELQIISSIDESYRKSFDIQNFEDKSLMEYRRSLLPEPILETSEPELTLFYLKIYNDDALVFNCPIKQGMTIKLVEDKLYSFEVGIKI